MKTSLVTISAEKSIYDAARVMKEKNVGSVLVKKNGVVCAIVTEKDLVRKALALKKLDLTVGDVASKPLITIKSVSDLSQAAALMGKKKVKRLLVTRDGQAIVGIVSSTDIIRISPSLYDLISEHEKLLQG